MCRVVRVSAQFIFELKRFDAGRFRKALKQVARGKVTPQMRREVVRRPCLQVIPLLQATGRGTVPAGIADAAMGEHVDVYKNATVSCVDARRFQRSDRLQR